MKIYKRLPVEHIFLNAVLKDKDAVFRFVADTFSRSGVVNHAELLYERMMERERTMSTGIGNRIGIPHAASPEAAHPAVILIHLADPIDFQALDGLPVDIVLALVVPENQTALHLQILAGISRLCKKAEFQDYVRQAVDPNELLEGMRRIEEEMIFH